MKRTIAVKMAVLGFITFGVPGCAKSEAPMRAAAPSATSEAAPAAAPTSSARSPSGGSSNQPAPNQIPSDMRKIIRTAEMSLETTEIDQATKKVTALAAEKGGFVVSSDTSSYGNEDGRGASRVTIVMRVPSPTFEATLDALRAIGKRVSHERVSGQDVTEEYLDLEARLRTQRAVEEQFLTIMKQARTIHDTLEVQQKLGEVRGEIERAEGRRRFLESQTSLSTITVHLAREIDAVESGPGFGRNVKHALRDAVTVAIGIVNFGIRAIGVLVPVSLLVILPFWLLIRLIRRRRK